MTTLSYTVPTAGVDANAVADPEIATALSSIKTWANGNVDGANLPSSLPGRRLIGEARGSLQGGSTVGTYLFNVGGACQLASSGSSTPSTWWQWDSTLYTIPNRTSTVVLRATIGVNTVAPAATFTVALNSLTSIAGSGAPVFLYNVGSAAGTVPAFTTPAGQTAASAEVSIVSLASGFYIPTVVQSGGTMAANSAIQFLVQAFA